MTIIGDDDSPSKAREGRIGVGAGIDSIARPTAIGDSTAASSCERHPTRISAAILTWASKRQEDRVPSGLSWLSPAIHSLGSNQGRLC